MGALTRRVILIIGGFLRWLVNSWRGEKSLRNYFEMSDGSEDTKQRNLNFIVGVLFILLSAALVAYFFTPPPAEFKRY